MSTYNRTNLVLVARGTIMAKLPHVQRADTAISGRFARFLRAAALAVPALPAIAGAHHSFAGFYYPDRTIEIEGVVTEVSWFNPHGRMRVEVTDESGASNVWDVETGSVSVLRTRGVDPDLVQVGDRIRLAGDAAIRNDTGIYGRQLLLADGREILLSIGVTPRWTDAGTGELIAPAFDEQTAAAARQSAEGIFRVWGTILDDPAAFPMYKGGYPLTEAGRATLAQWDAASAALNDCTLKAMPYIMITPYPIEFVRDGDDIVIRMEEDDAVRRIHMGRSVAAERTQLPRLLDRNVGRRHARRRNDAHAGRNLFSERRSPERRHPRRGTVHAGRRRRAHGLPHHDR